MDSAEKKLQALLDLILDATASDEERQEFAELIEHHPELAGPFVAQLRTHSLLQWQCDELHLGQIDLADVFRTGDRSAKSASRFQRSAAGWLMAIAASLLITIGAIWWQSSDDTQADIVSAIAEVVEERGVTWSNNTDALEDGRAIRAGRLEIESGTLTLRFRSGPTVVLRGAASAHVVSDMLVRLDRGQATAQVPHWATGFTIETKDVEVIDLGTQFGVEARDDGVTDVVIFEGKVDVKPTAGSVLKRLNQGEAARINRDGEINRIVEVRGDLTQGWTTGKHGAATQNVFASIRDNIPPSDGSKYYYYQITTGGLVDDASAYVDGHPHQWNGLSAEGLPEYLRGADFARTFNDYRYMRGFEIVVELAGPANLYVFFDDRVPTPQWLKDDFEDTGEDIGLDEGPWEGIPEHRTAVGGGQSIDNVFSVWRRRCERPETVALGAVGNTNEARAMYGIAATPLDEEQPPVENRGI